MQVLKFVLNILQAEGKPLCSKSMTVASPEGVFVSYMPFTTCCSLSVAATAVDANADSVLACRGIESVAGIRQ